MGNPTSLQWIGHLLPPDSSMAALMPHADDAAGRHYDAARAVSLAWLFQSSLPQPMPLLTAKGDPQPIIPQVDRVIFYRGGGYIQMPARVATEDDHTFTLTGDRNYLVKAFFAVQSTPKGIAWQRLDGFALPADENKAPVTTFVFPDAVAREIAIPALRKTVIETLVKEGLSCEEAAAMVETWNDLWFGESGTRVLSIQPEAWVAQTVPLAIEPAPAEVKRVYVARLEILTKASENGLLELLADKSSPKQAAPRLKALALGRFTEGAIERAQQMQAYSNRVRLANITAAVIAEEKAAGGSVSQTAPTNSQAVVSTPP